jgi:hypothetical protein
MTTRKVYTDMLKLIEHMSAEQVSRDEFLDEIRITLEAYLDGRTQGSAITNLIEEIFQEQCGRQAREFWPSVSNLPEMESEELLP